MLSTDPQSMAYNFATNVINYTSTASIRGLPNNRSEKPKGRFNLWLPCCFCVGGNEKDNTTGVILLTIAVVFSFFVMLRCTFKSLARYIDTSSQLTLAKIRQSSVPATTVYNNTISQQFPPFGQPPYNNFSPNTFNPTNNLFSTTPSAPPQNTFGPSYNPTLNPFNTSLYPQAQAPSSFPNPIFNQPSPVTNQSEVIKNVYVTSQIVLKKLKEEAKYTTLFQATITIGCGLLTAALVVAFLVEAEFLLMTLAVAGGGAVVIGAIGWGMKYAFIRWGEIENEALQQLKTYSLQLAPVFNF